MSTNYIVNPFTGNLDATGSGGGGGATNLNGLSGVTITSPVTGEVLRYDGSKWVDAVLAYSDLSGTPTLATVATTGAYSDLSGTPSLATVATTGAYSDLSGTPSLATVATTGSYSDLSDQPVIDGIGTNILNLYDSSTVEVATSTAYTSYREFDPVWIDVPPATGRYLQIDNDGAALPMMIEFNGAIYDQGIPSRAGVYSTGILISKGLAKLGVPVSGPNYTLYLDYTAIGTNPYGGYFAYGNHTYAAVEASLDASATTPNRVFYAIGYNTTNSRHFIGVYNTHSITVSVAFDHIKVYYV